MARLVGQLQRRRRGGVSPSTSSADAPLAGACQVKKTASTGRSSSFSRRFRITPEGGIPSGFGSPDLCLRPSSRQVGARPRPWPQTCVRDCREGSRRGSRPGIRPPPFHMPTARGIGPTGRWMARQNGGEPPHPLWRPNREAGSLRHRPVRIGRFGTREDRYIQLALAPRSLWRETARSKPGAHAAPGTQGFTTGTVLWLCLGLDRDTPEFPRGNSMVSATPRHRRFLV